MMVTGAPVPSTVPRQVHLWAGMMSTVERTIVNIVSSLSLTRILAGSRLASGRSASLVSAYSTIGAIGAAIMFTRKVARDAFARSTTAFCVSVILTSAAAVLTASTFSFGTAHISVLVSVSTWLLASPASLRRRL